MLHDFRFPQDLYFWGQDRVGSIIPVLGQIPHKSVGISAIWSETIVHSFILILGYLAFATFLKTRFSRLAFAIVWFLPISPFLGLVRYSFGLQYSLMAIGIFAISRYLNLHMPDKKMQSLAWMSIAWLAFTSAIWITDSAVVTVGVVLVFAFYSMSKRGIGISVFEYSSIIVGSTLSAYIIYLMKSHAVVSSGYIYNTVLFNSPAEFWSSVIMLVHYLGEVITFSYHEFFISTYACLLLLVLLISGFLVFKRLVSNEKAELDVAKLFIADGILSLFLILISNWAFLNELAQRYFVGVYISFWLAFLIWLDSRMVNQYTRLVKSIVSLALTVGIVSIIYGFAYVYPKSLTSKLSIVSELNELGEIGIIAEYWNAYSSSVANPEQIIAIPHEYAEQKNPDRVNLAFAQPRLFLIRDMWLDTFPERIVQFGRHLIRSGDEFRIGGSWLCEYKITPFDMMFKATDMLFLKDSEHILTSEAGGLSIVDNTELHNIFVVYGPKISVPEGDFSVEFKMRLESSTTGLSFARLEVSAEHGEVILAEKNIGESDFIHSNTEQLIVLTFNTQEPREGVEFRVYFEGGASFILESVHIQQVKSNTCTWIHTVQGWHLSRM